MIHFLADGLLDYEVRRNVVLNRGSDIADDLLYRNAYVQILEGEVRSAETV